ncbi:hypothetical protein F5Y12DRAFT_720157 [Xylaria sp. FL1777]|nr:hypothetical protein F5Y12DRAFT_720157 [Xylaria sp. FL1777]
MAFNGDFGVGPVSRNQDDIDLERLCAFYPSQVFYQLWWHARHDIQSPLRPGQTYVYVVIKEVRLRDFLGRPLLFNRFLSSEFSSTYSRTVGQFTNPHDANECAMIHFERLNASLRSQFADTFPHDMWWWYIPLGCIHLENIFSVNSSYTVRVSRRLVFQHPVQQPGALANSGNALI